jgi:hypothetical protein
MPLTMIFGIAQIGLLKTHEQNRIRPNPLRCSSHIQTLLTAVCFLVDGPAELLFSTNREQYVAKVATSVHSVLSGRSLREDHYEHAGNVQRASTQAVLSEPA